MTSGRSPWFHNTCKLLVLCLLYFSATQPAEVMSQTITLTVKVATQGHAPVEINNCYANVANYFAQTAVTFTATAPQDVTGPAVAVRFRFDLLDAFDTQINTLYGDLTGTFSRGALIDRTVSRNAYGIAVTNSYMWQGATSPGVAQVICSVWMVRFADGSVWRAGGN